MEMASSHMMAKMVTEEISILTSGFERLNFSLFANYDISENARIYFDVFKIAFLI